MRANSGIISTVTAVIRGLTNNRRGIDLRLKVATVYGGKD